MGGRGSIRVKDELRVRLREVQKQGRDKNRRGTRRERVRGTHGPKHDMQEAEP